MMKKRPLLLIMFYYLLIVCYLEAGASSVKDNKNEEKSMSVACAIINGKINNPAECNKIQKKILEKRCKEEKDPNACKAIEVAKKGKDPDGESLVKMESETKQKSKDDLKSKAKVKEEKAEKKQKK